MASAKRVAQDKKAELRTGEFVTTRETVTKINGKIVDTLMGLTTTEFRSCLEYVSQPDRILLDVSVDEALAIRAALTAQVYMNSKHPAVITALATALFSSASTPVSAQPATTAAPNVGQCSLGQTPSASGLIYTKAQEDARKYEAKSAAWDTYWGKS